MRLLGKDVSGDKLVAWVQARLEARGLAGPSTSGLDLSGVEPRVDPFAINVEALGEHADATSGLPAETHRGGLGGRAVLLAKRVFRTTCQVFINEALSRQVVFNGHVRDSYAQLSAEVVQLRERVGELQAELDKARAPAKRAPAKKKSAPKQA